MTVRAKPGTSGSAPAERTLPDATVRAAAGWVAQFARTLKTCRLYDARNPAVVRFREELAHATHRLLDEYGSLTFHFQAEDVTCDGQSLYPAKSRDDNLAYPFHRDGVRSITLQPGLETEEIDTLVNLVLATTGSNLEDGDLVTLLWEADLRHVDVDFIPSEGDVGSGAPPPPGEGEASLIPWPDAPPPQEPAADEPKLPETRPGANRSEDWTLGDLTVEVEASYVELDTLAPVETERFRREFTEEHLVSPVTAALAIATACLRAGANADDRREVAQFMPRVLRGAMSLGAWSDASEALRAMRAMGPGHWSEETFVQELLQPVSVARIVERVDSQEPDGMGGFLALASEIGDPGIDWMTLVLAESQQRTVRQVIAEALADRCRENPERLAPWLSDGRWYVVRNIVHILGWIGGSSIVGLLQVALRHPDHRVRAQVVSSLGPVELRLARPLLVRALDGAETRLFCQALNLLSAARDPATARYLFAYLQQDRFAQRPVEERRAIYAALASVGGDEIVAELEAELFKGNWFDRAQEVHRHNVARILARISTPLARQALDRGAQSKRAPVRQAANMALATLKEAA
jgi:hypothetical protein